MGKTTIGKELYAIHKEEYKNTIFLDGDILESLGDLHDINGRKINAHRISNLCLLLDKQNIHVIACVYHFQNGKDGIEKILKTIFKFVKMSNIFSKKTR